MLEPALNEELKRTVLTNGFVSATEVPTALRGGLTLPQLKRWFERFKGAVEARPPVVNGRMANNFCIGADPEFSLVHPSTGYIQSADSFNLAPGVCVGSDGNGRLAELRPAPFKSALWVTASLLAELRWLAVSRPKTLQSCWVATPFNGADGCGGHVHIGKRRYINNSPMRQDIVAALDWLQNALISAGMWDAVLVAARQNSRAHGRYGFCGDVRQQAHGFEYRTFPTWLDSPYHAFLALTLSKLVVSACEAGAFNPYLAPKGASAAAVLDNLLCYYKGLDNDALLAHRILRRDGFPKTQGTDFKPAWGVGKFVHAFDPTRIVEPGFLVPSAQEVGEVETHMFEKKMLKMGMPSGMACMGPAPEGFELLIRLVRDGTAGLEELLRGLVTTSGNMFSVQGEEGIRWMIPSTLVKRRELNDVTYGLGYNSSLFSTIVPGTLKQIGIPLWACRADNIARARKFLLCGLFPIWELGTQNLDALAGAFAVKWQKRFNSKRLRVQGWIGLE